MLVLEERGKTGVPTLGAQQRTNKPAAHIRRRVRESNPGQTGGRRALSPLCHPCSPGRNLSERRTLVFLFRMQKCIQVASSSFVDLKTRITSWCHTCFKLTGYDSFFWHGRVAFSHPSLFPVKQLSRSVLHELFWPRATET